MHQVEWLKKAVFYNIYPQSYYDTNGDGIGDLRGIIEKLDYIHYMGFNALWLNPFYESPFQDGGYDVSDYYKVASRYGTMEDFVELCERAHTLGIKVCVDLVGGHTSVEHPWFKESAKSVDNEYTNRYIWSDNWLNTPTGRFINGYSERNGCYMTNFFWSQPALNYGCAIVDDPTWQMSMDHPECRKTKQELLNIMEYWIKAGCDGFRVDLAANYVKNDPDGSGNKAFWNEIRALFDEKYPEHVLISEWGDPVASIDTGYHLDFLTHACFPAYTKLLRADKNRNVNHAWEGHSYFDIEGKGDFEEFLADYLEMREGTEGKGYFAIPTGNHDLPRYSVGRTEEELKVINAFLLTMPSVPFFYYGDEIGLKYQTDIISKEGGYNRTGSRTPMQWTKGKNLGFSQGEAGDLYLPVDASEDAPTVEEQLSRDDSLLHTIRTLLAIRQKYVALGTEASVEFINREDHGYPLVYRRKHRDESFIIAINPSNEIQIIKSLEKRPYETILQNNELIESIDGFQIAPVSYWIAKEM